MKTFLFSLLSLILIFNSSTAQDYAWAFPDSGMIWCQIERSGDGFSGGSTIEREIISSGQKVLRNGKWYTKLLETGVSTGGPFGMQTSSSFKDREFGMFWNDTLNKSVDCYTTYGERYIYDFDLEVGDTVKWFNESFISYPLTVDSIDTVTINGLNRKVFYYGKFLGDILYMIEGVGPVNGLGTCEGRPSLMDLGCGGQLNCFKIDSVVYSLNNGSISTSNNCQSCDYYVRPVGVNELESELSISIYPNPVDSKVFIEQKKEINNAQIEIRTITGKLIETIALTEQITEINTEDWISGTYFLTFRKGNQLFMKKLVVIH